MKNRTIMLAILSVAVVIFIVMAAGTDLFKAKTTSIDDEEDGTLKLLIWEEYIDPEVVEKFEQEKGIPIKVVTFSNMQEQEDILSSNPGEYDVVIIDDWTYRSFSGDGIFENLDKTKIPNLVNIGNSYKNLGFDPENRYTVPFMMGTTAMLVNTKYVYPLPDSWDVYWDEQYEGKTSFLDDPRELSSAVLKELGYSLNTKNKEEILEAKDLIFSQKAHLYSSSDAKTKAISGEIYIATVYSGDAALAMEINEDLDYIIPKEGASLWMDSMTIPKDSNMKEEAYQFINYLLEPEIGGMLANYAWYKTPNTAAKEYLDEEMLGDPTVTFSEEILAKSEYFENIPSNIDELYLEMYNSYSLRTSEDKEAITGISI